MFVLDTNVVSELRKGRSGSANKNVVAWAVNIPPSLLFLSVVTILELEQGALLMEQRDPKQGAVLRAWLERHVLPTFGDRLLQVDARVALRCAQLHVPNPKPDRDALIAATALVHGMTVATRNVRDFQPMGVGVVDPWTA